MSDEEPPNESSKTLRRVRLWASIKGYISPLNNPPSPSSIAIIGALGTLLGVGATLIAARISNYQLETAQQQLIVTDRPWVRIGKIEDINIYTKDDWVDFWMKISVKNVGKSPATGIEYHFDIFPMGHNTLEQQISYTCRDKPNITYGMGLVLFPDEEVSQLVSGSEIFRKPLDETDWTFDKFMADGGIHKNLASSDITERYAFSFTMILCASYEIYKDPKKHYTASVFDVRRNINFEEIRGKGREKLVESSFDWLNKKDYKMTDLSIVQLFGSSSRAD